VFPGFESGSWSCYMRLLKCASKLHGYSTNITGYKFFIFYRLDTISNTPPHCA